MVNKFPKICPMCRERRYVLRVQRYEESLAHDDSFHKVVIPDLEMLVCEACGSSTIAGPDLGRVTDALVEAAGILTAKEMRDGREQLGLTLEEMAGETGIAVPTLERWESGGLLQSRAMDNFLRAYFAMPDVRRFLSTRPGRPIASSLEPVSV